MSVGIDAALVAIVVFCAWRGRRRGIIRGLFGLIAIVLSIYCANLAASTYSADFTGAIRPYVGRAVDKAISNAAGSSETGKGTEMEHQGYDTYTASLSVLKKLGIPDNTAEQIAGKVGQEANNAGQSMSQAITSKVSGGVAYVLLFGICFVLLSFVFIAIGHLIGNVFAFSGLNKVDSFAGIILGFVKGVIIVYVAAVILRYIGLLSADTVGKTIILQKILDINPVANILGI